MLFAFALLYLLMKERFESHSSVAEGCADLVPSSAMGGPTLQRRWLPTGGRVTEQEGLINMPAAHLFTVNDK